MKMTMRKMLAVLATLAILCTVLPLGALFSAVADGDNLIVNGDFETGDATGWETWQDTAVSADAAHNGGYGANLKGNGGWGGMLNQTIAVEAGAQYKLSFWINVNAVGVNVQVKNGAGASIEGAGGWFDSNKKDKVVEWTFTATDDAVFVNFCGSGTNKAEDVYVDDFSLVKLGGGDAPAISDDGYIVNGDFETGDIAPWVNLWGSCPTAEVIEGGKDSAYALNVVSGQWLHVRQTAIAVEANTDYTVTVWAKNTNNMCLLVKNGADTVDIANVGVSAGDAWTEFVVEFNSGEYTSIIFSLMGGQGTDQYGIFDNVVMAKVGGTEPDPDDPGEEPAVPAGDVLSATFDGGETDGILSSSDISVADGALQFNVTKDWGNIYTGLEVEANTDYEVSFRAKSKLGKKFWVKFHKADWTGDICQETVSIAKDWTEYTYTMNTGDNTYVYLLVQYAGYGAEGETAWFDYITVTKVGGGETPDVPADGLLSEDFESGVLPEGWTLATDGLSGIEDGAFKLEGNAYTEILTTAPIAIKKGVTYTVEFDVKLINKGKFNFQIKNCPANNNGKGNNFMVVNIEDASVDAWTHYTYTFTHDDTEKFPNECMSLLFVVNTNTDFYVDNIVVTSDEEPEVPDEPVTGSVLVNGGFEDGSNGWELNSSSATIVDDARTGNGALQLSNVSMWGSAAVQTITVEPNTNYVVNVWVKREAGTKPFNLFLMNGETNANLTIVEGQIWFNTADSDWTERTIIVNTGDATSMTLKWSAEVANDGIMLIDDMQVYIEGQDPGDEPGSDTGLVVNGDFETGDITGWEKWQSTSISEEAAHNGKYGAHLVGNGGWGGLLNQTIAVENGETYTITLWVCINGKSGVNLQIKGADKVEGECDNTYLDPKELSGWTLRTFNVVANSDEITLNFCGGGTNIAEDIYIDDIVMVKEGELPGGADTSPIKNAGFETGDLTSWINLWNSCTYSFESPGYENSNYALNFEAPGQWQQIRQDMIPVEPNTDYVVVGYVKNPLNVNIVVKTGDDTANIDEVAIENDMSNKWIRAAVEFNSGDLDAICVLLIGREAGATAIFDNVQVYKKGEEPTDTWNEEEVTEGPIALDSFGVVINRPITADKNLILNGSFEEAEGGQWQSILGDTLYIVDDETAPDGDKSLYFNTTGVESDGKTIFYLDVEPETDYVFSVWVKGAFISDDNRFNATLGVTDWKDNFAVYSDHVFSNKDRQIVPTCWDNEWHLRSVQFNSGVNSKVGIGFAGSLSQMWVDDIALFKVDDGIKYADPRQIDYITPSTLYPEEGFCAEENSLIPDVNMDDAESVEFWSSAEGYKNGFLSFYENQYEYGTSLKYTGDDDSCDTYAIKWLEVKPNTTYTFSVNIRVVEDGDGKLALLDGKKRECFGFLMVDFSQYDYGSDWFSIAVEFDTGEFDRIGIAIVDGGGEALIDNMRLFESTNRVDGGITDDYVTPPYNFDDPDQPGSPDTGVSVMGAVLALALVPSSAAVAFKLRRKKEDEE